MRLTGFVIAMHKKIRRLPSGKQRKEYIQFVEKVCFFKKCLFSIPIPFRTLCWLCFCATVVVCCRCVLHRLCSTTCKHPCLKLGVSLFRHPCRKPLPRGEGLCMLSWLCIVQSLWAYTPGVRAGLSVGLPPSPRLGLRPKPHFQKYIGFSTD